MFSPSTTHGGSHVSVTKSAMFAKVVFLSKVLTKEIRLVLSLMVFLLSALLCFPLPPLTGAAPSGRGGTKKFVRVRAQLEVQTSSTSFHLSKSAHK